MPGERRRALRSAQALADDLRRYLDGEPIRARAISTAREAGQVGERLRPWAGGLGGPRDRGACYVVTTITLVYNARLRDQVVKDRRA